MSRKWLSLALGDIREEYITAALGPAPGAETRRGRRPSRRVWIAVLAALLALAATACAAGLFRSLFSRVPEEIGTLPDPEWYERAGELSQKEPETVRLEDLPGNAFTLTEAYYDGENLLLSYDLKQNRYPVRFGYGPGDEYFDQLFTPGAGYVPVLRPEEFFEEDWTRIEAILRGEESGGFVVREVYRGDHIRLTDGTDLGPMAEMTVDGRLVLEWKETEQLVVTESGETVSVRTPGLAEEARGRETLELVFTIREGLHYYYADNGLFYQYARPLGAETVTVSVPVSAG